LILHQERIQPRQENEAEHQIQHAIISAAKFCKTLASRVLPIDKVNTKGDKYQHKMSQPGKSFIRFFLELVLKTTGPVQTVNAQGNNVKHHHHNDTSVFHAFLLKIWFIVKKLNKLWLKIIIATLKSK
jgi:hypothetical protein